MKLAATDTSKEEIPIQPATLDVHSEDEIQECGDVKQGYGKNIKAETLVEPTTTDVPGGEKIHVVKVSMDEDTETTEEETLVKPAINALPVVEITVTEGDVKHEVEGDKEMEISVEADIKDAPGGGVTKSIIDVDKQQLLQKIDEEGEEEEEIDEDGDEEEPTTLQEVAEALSAVHKPGSTCTGGPAPTLPAVPGLHVEGIGALPLPLTQESISRLKQAAEQAPHGRGMETIVDRSVRNTLQVDANKVSLHNPSWATALRSLVEHSATDLGVSPGLVRAEIYKLLLYEPGGFFKKHRDTEKAPGMFATLVVQLPSQFTGGSFVVSHNGHSRTFLLDDAATAPYGCHYVAHYADCEHEIFTVESGHRLALVYSLCYVGGVGRGEISAKPSANDLSCGGLAYVLSHLPPEESRFCLPLEHQYTAASLARNGVRAFKGSDRARQQALERAAEQSGGKWKMVIAEVERTDHESGGGGGYCDFSVEDVESGDPDIRELFLADGKDGSCHRSWMSSYLSLTSMDDDGMILASEDDMECMWGDGDSSAVEYTGNEGATRETTYKMYLLVVFSEEVAFECMCTSNISNAIADTVAHPTQLDRLLRYMDRKNPSISCKDLEDVFGLINFELLPIDKTSSRLKSLLSWLSLDSVPSIKLADTLKLFISLFGWSAPMEPIRDLLVNRLHRCKNLNCLQFLAKFEFLYSFVDVLESAFLSPAIDRTVEAFKTETSVTASSLSYGYGNCYNKYRKCSAQVPQIANELVRLSTCHGWNLIRPAVLACYGRIRKECTSGVDNVVVMYNFVSALRDKSLPIPDVELLCKDILQDFLNTIDGAHGISMLSNLGAVQFLFEQGSASKFKRVKTCTAKASIQELEKLHDVFKQAARNVPATKCRDVVARDQILEFIGNRVKMLQIQNLRLQEQTLTHATRGGEPFFSWSMPKAETRYPALTSFLRSNRTGPETIVVGDGIANSRKIAARGTGRGYSASIRHTQSTGASASVVVQKTKGWHKAQVQQYQKNREALLAIRQKIHSLGGEPVPATDASRREVVTIEDTTVTPPASKRAKVTAPIPQDAEVLVID